MYRSSSAKFKYFKIRTYRTTKTDNILWRYRNNKRTTCSLRRWHYSVPFGCSRLSFQQSINSKPFSDIFLYFTNSTSSGRRLSIEPSSHGLGTKARHEKKFPVRANFFFKRPRLVRQFWWEWITLGAQSALFPPALDNISKFLRRPDANVRIYNRLPYRRLMLIMMAASSYATSFSSDIIIHVTSLFFR